MRTPRWLVMGIMGTASVSLALAGCATTVEGTPMADPNQVGVATTSPRTPTTRPSLPTRAPSAPPSGLAATTCGDYEPMDDATKRQVIAAIGQDNDMVGMNPELWVTMADAMCMFADKSTLVKDVVMGEGFG